MPASFQRARQPGQRAQRRQELIHAATRLLLEDGLDAVTLSAIARAAGMAKSGVYRYFESREALLLDILITDELSWVSDVERVLAPHLGSNDVDAVAGHIAATLTTHPIACELIPVVAGVLEHNLSTDTVRAFKSETLVLSIRIRNALHAALPSLPHAHTEALPRYLHALVAGLWPMAHPVSSVDELLTKPEYRGMRCDFENDLCGAFAAILRGFLS